MAGTIVSRTAHFALHRMPLDAPAAATGPESPRSASEGRLPMAAAARGQSRVLFAARDTWVGALLPKRWARRAVTRNAIKRQIYTVSQSIEPPLPLAAHVVRLRAGFDRAQFVSASSDALKRAVRGELQDLFARAAP